MSTDLAFYLANNYMTSKGWFYFFQVMEFLVTFLFLEKYGRD